MSEIQADAILNTRLRQLARLEEMEIRREHADLSEERDGVNALLGSDKQQWRLVGVGLRDVRKILGPDTVVGRRRSTFADAPLVDTASAIEAMVTREPITVILSERRLDPRARSRVEDPSELKFKEGDGLGFLVAAETTDKLLILASDGRFFTLACDKLPSAAARASRCGSCSTWRTRQGWSLSSPTSRAGAASLASKAGYGFILPEDEAIAFRRAGKQVLNGEGGDFAGGQRRSPRGGRRQWQDPDLPTGRKLPEMPRGKGVKLQSYRDGGLRDAIAFSAETGPGWTGSAGRSRAWPDWRDWLGKRASAGRVAPKGFPASKRFRPK